MKLYEKISLLRKQHGLSQEDLADKLEISRQSVHKWEQGLSYPEIDKIRRLAQIFGVSIDALLNDDIGMSAPSAQISKAPSFRSVFVSKNILKSNHSDYDHHTTAKSKKRHWTVPRSLKNTYADRSNEIEKQMAARGYECVIAPQNDLNVRFFTDEKRNVCGFFYDGAEQFVLPIENIIEANISHDGNGLDYSSRMTGIGVGVGAITTVGVSSTPMASLVQPRRYTLSIVYFNKDGNTEMYNINFGCMRTYFQFMGRPSEETAFVNALSISTQQSLFEIRNTIMALKAKGDILRSSFAALENIDVEALSKQSEEALKVADAQRATVEKKVKKSNRIFRTILASAIVLAVVVLFWEFFGKILF